MRKGVFFLSVFIFFTEYLMSGSPRNYATKGAKSPNNGVGPTQELLHCDIGLNKDGTLSAQNR